MPNQTAQVRLHSAHMTNFVSLPQTVIATVECDLRLCWTPSSQSIDSLPVACFARTRTVVFLVKWLSEAVAAAQLWPWSHRMQFLQRTGFEDLMDPHRSVFHCYIRGVSRPQLEPEQESSTCSFQICIRASRPRMLQLEGGGGKKSSETGLCQDLLRPHNPGKVSFWFVWSLEIMREPVFLILPLYFLYICVSWLTVKNHVFSLENLLF